MTNQQDIFKRLAEYEVEPPPAVWSGILQSFEMDKTVDADPLRGSMARVQSIDAIPPLGSYEFIISKIIDPVGLSKLQYFETTPPDEVYNRLFESIDSKEVKQISKPVTGKFAQYPLQAAAVFILLLIAAWLIYKSATNNGEAIIQPSLVKETVPVVPVLNDTAARLVLVDKKRNIKKRLTLTYSGQATVMIGEDQVKVNITDNDILASFAGFTYDNTPYFLKEQKKDKPFLIQADQYAAITVSAPMSAMMKRMNTFKKNGKLSKQAKRERKRLAKWKTADEKRFDKKVNNPIDPIDLGEFLLD